MRKSLAISCAFGFLALAACGTYVPTVEEVIDPAEYPLDSVQVFEGKIKEQIYCELKKAVVHATNKKDPNRVRLEINGKEKPALPDDWGVQVTLSLQADESGATNPGVSTIRPFLNMQNFTLGLGGTASSTATHVDKFEFYYDISKLEIPVDPPEADYCLYDNGVRRDLHNVNSSFLLISDLGIDQWLQDALYVENDYHSTKQQTNVDSGAFKQDVLSYETKFVVVTSGGVTPNLKLVRFTTGNGTLPLLSAGRTRTHDLLITFGPSQKPGNPGKKPSKGGPGEPTQAAANAHLASQIGLAVSNNLRPLLAP